MKKTVCILMALLAALSLVLLPVSAAEANEESDIMQELKQMTINDVPFDEANYPASPSAVSMRIICVIERGYRSNQSEDGYYMILYVYNPAMLLIGEHENNCVQISFRYSEDDEFADSTFYGVSLIDRSEDRRFLKFLVTNHAGHEVKELWQRQVNDNERVYNFISLQLLSGRLVNECTVTAYDTFETFVFTGRDYDNTLSCRSYTTGIEKVYLYATSWVSPNAGETVTGGATDKYDHYELHSVYFSMPRYIYDRYDYMCRIRAKMTAYDLTPIVVTEQGMFADKGDSEQKAADTTALIQSGGSVAESGKDIMDLVAAPAANTGFNGWYYSELDLGKYEEYQHAKRYDRLAYLFELSEGSLNFEDDDYSNLVFSSEELTALIHEQENKGIPSSALYHDKTTEQKDFQHYELWDLKSFTEGMNWFEKWWFKITTSNDIQDRLEETLNDYHKFLVFAGENEFATNCVNISNYTNISKENYEAVSEELAIGVGDVEAFSEFCAEAQANDRIVVLLRHGFSDYRCAPLKDVWEFTGAVGNQVGYSIEKTAYEDVSVCELGFVKNQKEYTVPVFSNVVDNAGDGVIFKPESNFTDNVSNLFAGLFDGAKDVTEKAKDVFKLLLFVAAIVVLVVLVIKLLPGVIKIFSTAGEARRRRKQEEKENKDKKNE